MPKKRYVVRLTESEREELAGLLKKKILSAHKRRHAQILLKADEGKQGPAWTDAEVAKVLEIHPNTVKNVRQRFVEEGLEAAVERKKLPPRGCKLDGAQEARLVALACSVPPEGRSRWSLRLLADRMVALDIIDDISHETVRQTLKKTI